MRTVIQGLGTYLPEKIVTNKDLENLVETTDEWIHTRTGIRERRIAEKGVAASDLGAKAAAIAIANAGLTSDSIDLIIVSTITPDNSFPSTACHIQRKLNIGNAACFDLSAACSGFPYALTTADAFLKTGAYRTALIVSTEVLSPFIDWTDRSTCVLFGDGAGACVLTVSNDDQKGILATYLGADGNYADILKIPAGGSALPPTHETIDDKMHTVKMQGSEVFKIAVRTMADSVLEVCKRAGITIDQVDCVVPHQANMRIINAMAERLSVPLDKIFINLDVYGNMSAASTAVALSEAVASGKIVSGNIAVLVAFGSGLTWGACAIKW